MVPAKSSANSHFLVTFLIELTDLRAIGPLF